ncbi:Hypothetical predicted protein [Olea europaea subsp. europaea]|uniref:Uncharacterized protein n=1 Tax=Olea europaea subsp. europaea TaxID=158383 RepID=A0A8S0Q7S8_OLEEU|nr:Hypothetical predicted protein [Olea europaea subsp. europaea]
MNSRFLCSNGDHLSYNLDGPYIFDDHTIVVSVRFHGCCWESFGLRIAISRFQFLVAGGNPVQGKGEGVLGDIRDKENMMKVLGKEKWVGMTDEGEVGVGGDGVCAGGEDVGVGGDGVGEGGDGVGGDGDRVCVGGKGVGVGGDGVCVGWEGGRVGGDGVCVGGEGIGVGVVGDGIGGEGVGVGGYSVGVGGEGVGGVVMVLE